LLVSCFASNVDFVHLEIKGESLGMPYNLHFVFEINLLKIALDENYRACACLKPCG